jgi:rRNA biogenesis protein RRP5
LVDESEDIEDQLEMEVDSDSSTEEEEMKRDALEDEEPSKKKRKAKKSVADTISQASPDDFEKRLIREGPGSEEAWRTWTEYAGHYVRVGEVQQARAVIRRGLDAAQTEAGKFELYVVWMNLEAHFGEGEVQKVFNEAVQLCDSKKIHKALCGVWKRADDWAKEKKSFEMLTKKHKHSRKCWLMFIERLFEKSLDEEGRSLAKKASQMIGEHKKLRFTTKLAMIEITHSFVERGVTVFEDILATNPKRTDLWNVYIDQLTKLVSSGKGEYLEPVRALFRRACALKIKLQNIAAFFKKWLIFETSYGTAESAEQVKTEAEKYIASI